MRPLERRPGLDPGGPGGAAWLCPSHSAHVGGLSFPGTPTGFRLCNKKGLRTRGPAPAPVRCQPHRRSQTPAVVGEGGFEPPFWSKGLSPRQQGESPKTCISWPPV